MKTSRPAHNMKDVSVKFLKIEPPKFDGKIAWTTNSKQFKAEA